jgi:hypothetical protein
VEEKDMSRILSLVAAAALAIALGGCASLSTPPTPCEKCDYGYVYVGKRPELRKWCKIEGDKATCCIKDGKIYDCSKNPPECPECAKRAEEHK